MNSSSSSPTIPHESNITTPTLLTNQPYLGINRNPTNEKYAQMTHCTATTINQCTTSCSQNGYILGWRTTHRTEVAHPLATQGGHHCAGSPRLPRELAPRALSFLLHYHLAFAICRPSSTSASWLPPLSSWCGRERVRARGGVGNERRKPSGGYLLNRCGPVRSQT